MAAHRDQRLEEVLDARAEIRSLRKRVTQTKEAWQEAKGELAAASDRLENALTDIEQRQGRLFGDDDQAEPKSRAS
jgi:predicted  nucleic acid-binding Zn-ribbon protein